MDFKFRFLNPFLQNWKTFLKCINIFSYWFIGWNNKKSNNDGAWGDSNKNSNGKRSFSNDDDWNDEPTNSKQFRTNGKDDLFPFKAEWKFLLIEYKDLFVDRTQSRCFDLIWYRDPVSIIIFKIEKFCTECE